MIQIALISLSLPRAALSLLLAVVTWSNVWALPSADRMSVVVSEVTPDGPGGDCGGGVHPRLAGTSLDLIVRYTLYPSEANVDSSLRLIRGWPEGVDIEFSLAGGAGFRADPALRERFSLRPIVTRDQLYQDSLWAAGQPWSAYMSYEFRTFHFTAVVPAELGGKTVYIRGYCETPEFGRVPSNYDLRFDVVAPCSRDDTLWVVGSRIWLAQHACDFAAGIAIADSQLAADMVGTLGFEQARHCAERLGRFDLALFYLDTLYQTTGQVIWFPRSHGVTLEKYEEFYQVIRRGLQEDAARNER